MICIITVLGKLTHQLINLRQIRQRHRLKRTLDQTTSEKVQRLDAILAITDVGTLDVDHAHDGAEDGGLQVRVGGQTDGDDGSARSNVAGGLLEGEFGDGDEDHGVRTEAVAGGGLDVVDEVFGFGEVDVGLLLCCC